LTASWLDTLADFLALGAPVGTVRDQAGLVLADTIGAIAAGTLEPEFGRLAADGSLPGRATVPGTRLDVHPLRAALLNGIAGTAVEIDEGHYEAGGHPAIHCLAAALPEAEVRGASGRDLLDALILAYEAATRIGAATSLRDAVHAHGTWGTIGAAVAVARLRGFSTARMKKTLCVAASLTLATSRTSGLVGATVRTAYAGFGAQNGMLACDLVEAGFEGETNGLDIAFGQVVGEAFDSRRIAANLGADWRIGGNFFKPHASCRETHGAIEAWERLVRRPDAPPIAAEMIAAIEIETFSHAARLDEHAPHSPLAARYSLPFALATRIRRGGADVADFFQAAVEDPAIRRLAGLVRVTENAGMTARLPAERMTALKVTLEDGRSFSVEIEGSEGDPSRPLGPDRLAEKFRSVTRPVWGDEAPELFERWRRIDGEHSLASLLRRAPQKSDALAS